MINFFKSLYRKLFGIKAGSYDSRESSMKFAYDPTFTYDPSQDENRIMSGEVETYFD